MNDYIMIGKIINYFGIKGEVKIISDFEYPDKVFKKEMSYYIGKDKAKEVVKSHRLHKSYHLISFEGLDNINDIIKYKNDYVYVKREELELKEDEYLLDELIGYKVYDKEILIGEVIDYVMSSSVLLKVKGKKEFYLPNIPEYIKKIDKESKKIITDGGANLIL